MLHNNLLMTRGQVGNMANVLLTLKNDSTNVDLSHFTPQHLSLVTIIFRLHVIYSPMYKNTKQHQCQQIIIQISGGLNSV